MHRFWWHKPVHSKKSQAHDAIFHISLPRCHTANDVFFVRQQSAVKLQTANCRPPTDLSDTRPCIKTVKPIPLRLF